MPRVVECRRYVRMSCIQVDRSVCEETEWLRDTGGKYTLRRESMAVAAKTGKKRR